ncbi:MAG: ATP-binding protein [Pseudomonadota bacterium]
MSEVALLVDPHGMILGLSPAFEALSGWLEDDLIGQALHQYYPDDQGLECDGVVTMYPGDSLSGLRRYRCRDGGFFRGEAAAFHLRGNEGAIAGTVLIFHTISDRVQRSERLLPLLHAFDVSNGERHGSDDLERFARIASHDMREPLRRIIAYCDLLKEEYGAELPNGALEIASIIQSGGRRLQLIVDDILVYARVRGQLDRAFEPVDMSAALSHAMDEMNDEFQARGVRVDAAHLPLVWGRAPLFKMVFRHLLSNALKHCGEHSPMINIAVEDNGDVWKFAVTDEGLGIESQHADRIFEIFQRLYHKDEGDGSGAGLAICRLIVERCGGEIWLDRAYDRGARFLFTLPKAKPSGLAETSSDHAVRYS